MTVQRLEADELVARALAILGLDATETTETGLLSTEALGAALRRAASYLCPAAPRQIVDAVLEALAPLGDPPTRDDVNQALEALISAGDLLELRPSATSPRVLFLGPPSYVEKHLGEYLLLGVRPGAAPLIDEEILAADIVYQGHTRSVALDPDTGPEKLTAAGLHRWDRKQWCRIPRQQPANELIERLHQRLSTAPSCGQITDLTIIDPQASVRYYKGRWREPAPKDDGVFVGRRPQAYGTPLWCLVELAAGVPQALLDLPTGRSGGPSWDEARQVQAALDAQRGTPQEFQIRPTDQGDAATILDVFAPLPTWAERHLTLVGWPTSRSKGALASYWIPDGAVSDVRSCLTDHLWMIDTKGSQEQ